MMPRSTRHWFAPRVTPTATRRPPRCPIEVGLLEGRLLLSGPGDVTAPVTVAQVSGVAGTGGYYRSPVTINLTASDVDDAAGSLTTFSRVNGGPLVVGNTVALTGDGTFSVAFFSRDPAGNGEATQTRIIRIDQTAPTITAIANPTSLWPPNHKLVPVTVIGHVADSASGAASTVSYGVVDEYGNVQPSGTANVGANGNYRFVTYLESSRLGQDKDGRQYIINVTAGDLAGNQDTTTALVIVPHDRGRHNGQSPGQNHRGGGGVTPGNQGGHGRGNQGGKHGGHGRGNQGDSHGGHGHGNQGGSHGGNGHGNQGGHGRGHKK